MPLSWNEIRHSAIAFSKEWQGVKSEQAEKQTFWNEFFNVFGVRRRVVATFEEPVKKISGKYGFIDLIWPGDSKTLMGLVEQETIELCFQVQLALDAEQVPKGESKVSQNSNLSEANVDSQAYET